MENLVGSVSHGAFLVLGKEESRLITDWGKKLHLAALDHSPLLESGKVRTSVDQKRSVIISIYLQLIVLKSLHDQPIYCC